MKKLLKYFLLVALFSGITQCTPPEDEGLDMGLLGLLGASGVLGTGDGGTNPAIPQNVIVTAGNGEVSLTWDAIRTDTTYAVYYGTAEGVTVESENTVSVSTNSATIDGLTNETTYYFIVAVVDAAGNPDVPSDEVSATPTIGVPAGVSAAAGANQVTVAWTANANASSFKVYYGTSTGVDTSATTFETTTTNSVTITDLTNETEYYFVVTALDSASVETQASDEVSATPTIGIPTGVTASIGDSEATITWTANANASSYTVYYATSEGVDITSATSQDSATNSANITGLTNDTTYYFVVTATDSDNIETGASDEVSATPTSGVPTGVAATGDDGEITVSWTDISFAESYVVYYGTTAGVSKASTSKPVTTNSTTINGLTNGTTYYFVVTSIDADSYESDISSEVSAKATAGAPTGVSATAGAEEITVSWSAVSGVTNYTVYYGTSSTVSSSTGTPVAVAGATTKTITTLNPDTKYYFVVTGTEATETSDSSRVNATPYFAGFSAKASGVTKDLNQVIYDSGSAMFWAVGDGETLLYSNDGGDTWINGNITIPSSTQDYLSIATDSAGKMLIGATGSYVQLSGTSGAVWTLNDMSPAGLNWYGSYDYSTNAIRYDSTTTQFFMAAYSNAADYNRIITMTSGFAIVGVPITYGPTSKQVYGLATDAYNYLFAAGADDLLLYCDDVDATIYANGCGQTNPWTVFDGFGSPDINSAYYDATDDFFLYPAEQGIVYSGTGISTTNIRGSLTKINEVTRVESGAANAAIYLAVGDNGALEFSSTGDGLSWSTITPPENEDFLSIADDGAGNVIVVGTNGTIYKLVEPGNEYQ